MSECGHGWFALIGAIGNGLPYSVLCVLDRLVSVGQGGLALTGVIGNSLQYIIVDR